MKKYLKLYHSDPYDWFISYTELTENFKQLLIDLQHSIGIQKELFGADVILELRPDINIFIEEIDGVEDAVDIIEGYIRLEDVEKPADYILRITEDSLVIEARASITSFLSSSHISLDLIFEAFSR